MPITVSSSSRYAKAIPDPLKALARIPWEGGAAYWQQFPTASAWTDPNFFPVGVFYGKPGQAASLASIGVNTFLGAEHDGTAASAITSQGSYLLPQQHEWTASEIGSNTHVPGWLVSDECDMGLGPCGGGDEFTGLAVQTSIVNSLHARNDGRFLCANYGNGVLRTFWSHTVMPNLVQLVDASSADQYAYTSPSVQGNIFASPQWPSGATIKSSATYGWLTDQTRSFQDPAHLHPAWAFVEVRRPYLTEPGATTITPNQLEGAVWSSIIHEARGIMFFQHNNDPAYGNYGLIDNATDVRAKVTQVTSDIRSLAPVINSQSYAWDFAAGADTMLKWVNGETYIFAGVGLNQTTGSKTFHLPTGLTAATQVDVVGEGRTLSVSAGTFTDTFAAEYTHHIYRIVL